MAKNEIQNGQAEYGVIHVMENEMREAGDGVFEESSTEAGPKRRRKAEPEVANKAVKAAPANKSTTKASNNPTAKKRAAK